MLIRHIQFLNMRHKKTLNFANKQATKEFSQQVISISKKILIQVVI